MMIVGKLNMHRIEGRSPGCGWHSVRVFPNASFQGQILAKMKLANDISSRNKAHDPCTSACRAIIRAISGRGRCIYEGALAYYALSNDAATLNHAVIGGPFIPGACAAGTQPPKNCLERDPCASGQDLYRAKTPLAVG